MSVERREPSRIACLEQRVTQLEREKIALEAALSTSQAEMETALKATRQEAEAAKEETVEARRQVDAKKKELQETIAQQQVAHHTISVYLEAVRVGDEPLQEEIGNLLEKHGLEAPDLSPNTPTINISELWRTPAVGRWVTSVPWWLFALLALPSAGIFLLVVGLMPPS